MAGALASKLATRIVTRIIIWIPPNGFWPQPKGWSQEAQFGEATGREEFIKYLSGDCARNWVQAAAARVAEEQPNWSPPMPAPVRISNEDGANAGISSQRGAASVKPPRPVHSLGEHSAAAVHP